MSNSKNAKHGLKISQSILETGGIHCNICKSTFQNKFNFERHYKTHSKDAIDDFIIIYTCLVCYKEVPSYSSFREHCYQHTIKNKLLCHKCQKSFSKTQALMDHMKNIHKIGSYACPAPCNKTFDSLQEFKMHTQQHKQENKNTCQMCKTPLSDQTLAESHVNDHIEYSYSCPICDHQIVDKDSAPKHLQTHFENETLDLAGINESDNTNVSREPRGVGCNICMTTFKTKVDFESHYLSEHNDEIVYSCTVCWKTFAIYSLFGNHCYNHVVKGKFKCDICNKTFPRLQLLVVHTQTVHSRQDSGKPFPCVQCHLEFSNGKSLKAHLLDSHGVAYQICPHPGCGKMFDSPTALVFHEVDHKDTPQKKCNTCGLPFKNLLACFKHMSVHTKTKYVCPICSRKYTAKFLVIKHLKQHYQAAMHICDVCGKSYNLNSRLLEHMKTHKESNICTYCKKHFHSKATLNDHINVHTKETPYECWICHKKFSAASSWRKHMKNIHNKSTKKSDLPVEINGKNNNNDIKLGSKDNTNSSEDIVTCDENDEIDEYFNDIPKKKNKVSKVGPLCSLKINPSENAIHLESDESIIKERNNNSYDPFENNVSNEKNHNTENVNGQIKILSNYLIVNGKLINETNNKKANCKTNKEKIKIFNEQTINKILPNSNLYAEKEINSEKSHILNNSLINEVIDTSNGNKNCVKTNLNNNLIIMGIKEINSLNKNKPVNINKVTKACSFDINDVRNGSFNRTLNNNVENIEFAPICQIDALYDFHKAKDNTDMVVNNQMKMETNINIVSNELINNHQFNISDSVASNRSINNFQNNDLNEGMQISDNNEKIYNFEDIETDLTMAEAVNVNDLMEVTPENIDSNYSDETTNDEDKNIILEIGALTEDFTMNPPEAPPSVLPLEYGPEFITNTSIEQFDYENKLVYLNETVYPHVNPQIMTKPEQKMFHNQQLTYLQNIGYNSSQIINSYAFETNVPFNEFAGQYYVVNPSM